MKNQCAIFLAKVFNTWLSLIYAFLIKNDASKSKQKTLKTLFKLCSPFQISSIKVTEQKETFTNKDL